MRSDDAGSGDAGICPWCGRPADEARTVTIGPPAHLGDAHAFELHRACVAEWESFVSRARRVAARGARETLIAYPVENGTADLRRR